MLRELLLGHSELEYVIYNCFVITNEQMKSIEITDIEREMINTHPFNKECKLFCRDLQFYCLKSSPFFRLESLR